MPLRSRLEGSPCHMPQVTVYFKLDDIDLPHGSNDLHSKVEEVGLAQKNTNHEEVAELAS